MLSDTYLDGPAIEDRLREWKRHLGSENPDHIGLLVFNNAPDGGKVREGVFNWDSLTDLCNAC